jgi:hypothetical protein
MNFETTPPRGREQARTEIILKTDECQVALELGLEGKFAAKSTGWDKNRVFLEGDRLEIEVKGGRWVLTHQPPSRRRRSPSCTTGRTTSDAVTAGENAVALRCHLRTSRQATVLLMKRRSASAASFSSSDWTSG